MTGGAQVAASRPAWRRYGIRLIGLILFAIVLATVDLRQVWTSVSQISPWSLAEALGLCVLLLLLKCLRWFLLLRWMGIPQRIGESVNVYADSLFWGMITPGRLGELKRTLYLKRHRNVPLVRAGALWLIDQGFDLLAIASILLAAVFVEPPALGGLVPRSIALLAAAFVVLALAFRAPLLRAVRLAFRRGSRVAYLVDGATHDLIALSNRQFMALFGISLVALTAYVGMVVLLAESLPFSLTLSHQSVAVALVMTAALLPISYLNLGSREMVLAGLFSVYGLGFTEAVSYSFVFILCYLMVIPTSIALSRLAADRRHTGAL